ncbi:FAD-dependent oxidoreductase [Magnetospira sp. QH-2]|uniref:FAD-dependent oxidoreductase n=1 Tax=Magnetospira sp. (strain QH-2) TaxID=1288970 RepID=UPI0003E814BE|nr:FAD-dependent oxidoreductase [Magnetospira sp. QH-2]CCQ73651.1 Putative NADPH-dependent glutamate synthase beta chain and related oxidoreductases [Magnetospira sp. QH-2]
MAVLTRGAYALPGTSLDFKTGTWRVDIPYHQHWSAPCHTACPAGEDQQAWLAKIQENKLHEAWEVLVAANPMPAITGRVCPHPCESACNRAQYDEPIAIHNVERFLGDEAIRLGWKYPILKKVTKESPSVAVVGAGPAGLSAAYHLVRRGFKVNLFDALPEAGGLLRSAIPMTRLPRKVLDAEIERIFALNGLKFHPRHRLGRDISLGELQNDHSAVFMGPGAERSKNWDVDGAVPADLHQGLHLIKEWVDHGEIPTPKSVAIHGGGNTAVDLARIMKRRGVEEVYVITASGLPGPDTAPDDILNVVPRELEEAIEEGVIFYPHRTIQRLIMRGSKLIGVEMVHLKKLPGKGGRKSRISFQGTERVLNVDMVIPSIGEAVDAGGFEKLVGNANYFKTDDWGNVSDHPGVFVGGDARGDRGTVSAAVGDGRKAAEAVEAFIKSKEPVDDVRETLDYDKLNVNYYEPAPRSFVGKLPVIDRTDFAEIEQSLEYAQVIDEGARCFSCGNCLACDNCWTYCPDNAVVKTRDTCSDGSHYLFDYEFCKGCGMCAAECPCGYILMKHED